MENKLKNTIRENKTCMNKMKTILIKKHNQKQKMKKYLEIKRKNTQRKKQKKRKDKSKK